MTFVYVVVFAKFLSLEAAALLATEKIEKSVLDTSADPNSSRLADPKMGPAWYLEIALVHNLRTQKRARGDA